MLPEFPNFKKIELSDRKDVEEITRQYPPYSDFNFASMWSWNTKDQMRLSVLYGNLVVRFTDYLTDKSFYSFLGSNKVNETAEALLELSKKEGLELKLKLVPEDSVKNLNSSRFNIMEDRDNFDYIYTTESLAKMTDKKFKKRRQHIRLFQKNFYPKIKNIDLSNKSDKEEIINLFNEWHLDKEKKSAEYFKNEFDALVRFLSLSGSASLSPIGIYSDNKMIACSINENTHNDYNMGHFQKARTNLSKGVYNYLVNEHAKLLLNQKVQYMNWQQDLGILGLRENKESHLPHKYLKKFYLSI